MADNTPSEKTTSSIAYFDADGKPTSRDQAAAAEITESIEGVEIRRTYLERNPGDVDLPQWREPGGVLAEPDVLDFAKATWDVYVNDNGTFRLAATLEDWLSAMDLNWLPAAERRREAEKLTKLPSWRAAPNELKEEVREWLAEG